MTWFSKDTLKHESFLLTATAAATAPNAWLTSMTAKHVWTTLRMRNAPQFIIREPNN